MSSPRSESFARSGGLDLFHLEQAGALLAGLTCLAIDARTAAHSCRAAFSTHAPVVREGAHPASNWLLMIAVALIGTALTRFAFTARTRTRADNSSLFKARYRAKHSTGTTSGSHSSFVSREGNR